MFSLPKTEDPVILPASTGIEATQKVRFMDATRADRFRRKVIDNIQAHETTDALDTYMDAESVVLDGLHIFDGAMAQTVQDAFEEHRAALENADPVKRLLASKQF